MTSARQRTFWDQKSWLLRPFGRDDWVGRFGIRGLRQRVGWVGLFGIRGHLRSVGRDDWVGRFGIRGRLRWVARVDWVGPFGIRGLRLGASKDRLFLGRAPRGGQKFYGCHHPNLRSWDLGIRYVGFGRQAASQRAWARTRFARRWAGFCGDSRYKGTN